MSGPRRPWTVALMMVLSDGGWHKGAAIVEYVAASVPPGVASRRILRKSPDALVRFLPARVVERGRRALALDTVYDALRKGRAISEPATLDRRHWRNQDPWWLASPVTTEPAPNPTNMSDAQE